MRYNRYAKRDAVKNHFPMPNEIFSLGLTAGEISVYSFLMSCEDRKTFQCHPSYKTIGRALQMSSNTVRKYVDGLREKQLISTETTQVTLKSGRKRNGNLRYTIRPIEEAVRHHYEQQMVLLEEDVLRQKALKNLPSMTKNTGKQWFEPSDFTCRNKRRGCKATPTRFTADGNADRITVYGLFSTQKFGVENRRIFELRGSKLLKRQC